MDLEKQEGTAAAAQPDRRAVRRIVLTRSIVLGGDHAEKGSTHDVGRALAHRLIAEGSAVLHESETPDAPVTTVTRMETPTNREPAPKQVAPAPAKVKRPSGK